MLPVTKEEQKTIAALTANWIWTPYWTDSASTTNTAARLVRFTRTFDLPAAPSSPAFLHCSADTRYKLFVNGTRVAVGPARGGPQLWFYDTVEIGTHLRAGRNELRFEVLRYFPGHRGGMPFERTALPGLTVVGTVEAGGVMVKLDSLMGWQAQVDETVLFPMGVPDDVFLHINERIFPGPPSPVLAPVPYHIKTLNGELSPWFLRPRGIPMPDESPCEINAVHNCHSSVPVADWTAFLTEGKPVTLPLGSTHTLDLQAAAHSTAFMRWTFQAAQQSRVHLRITYSEGYEGEPRAYPFLRSKGDRLNAANGHILGPCDDVTLDLPPDHEPVTYEPFWFRTFRILRLAVTVGPAAVTLVSLAASQTNYPLHPKAGWRSPSWPLAEQMWDISLRTLRNCMFDAYTDCPFYEQLQYAMDARPTAALHHLLTGSPLLSQRTLTLFLTALHPTNLTPSRFPSHTPQLIPAFSLHLLLLLHDHHTTFPNTPWLRQLLGRADSILAYFDAHLDPTTGLVALAPDADPDVWPYVDWVPAWAASASYPHKGVPTAARASSGRQTYLSCVYAVALERAAAGLARAGGREGVAAEYEARAMAVREAVRRECWDERVGWFRDATVGREEDGPEGGDPGCSQQGQVWAVLAGCCERPGMLLGRAFGEVGERELSRCSFMFLWFAMRAASEVSLPDGWRKEGGESVYDVLWRRMMGRFERMVRVERLSTWAEDDVRMRSDCHAWSCVPMYEFMVEVAGLRCAAPGWTVVGWWPRVSLMEGGDGECRVCCGEVNVVTVRWVRRPEGVWLGLELEREAEVRTWLPGWKEQKCEGVVKEIEYGWEA